MGLDNNYLERIHSEILTVMDEVVRVCNENNLRYYMIGARYLAQFDIRDTFLGMMI